MRWRTIAISLSVLAAAAGLAGGVAVAASQSGSQSRKAFGCPSDDALISDAAHRLNVTPARLTDALKQALVDQIDGAAASGRLPRAQAEAIKRQIEHGPGLPIGPGLFGPAVRAAQIVAPPGMPAPGTIRAQVVGPPGVPGPQAIRAHAQFGPLAILSSAARYLGLTDGQLIQRLRGGESLAQIAKAQGKSTSGLPRPPFVPGHVRIQVRAGGPPACFAGAIGMPPPFLLRKLIGPPGP